MNAFLTMTEVLDVVAPAFELTPQDVRSRRQNLAIAAARTAFCGLAAEFTSRCDSEIARLLDRDLATVVAARKRHARTLKLDPTYQARVWEIRLRLGDMREDLNSENDALRAARRFVAAGPSPSFEELRAICSRLIHVETAFQELAFFQESTHG